ncbi:MAG: RNA polymerase sigma factor [Muribaculaceae bacterium]
MNSREFKAKILPHYTSMYRVAASVMRSDDEAADIVQDAMLRLFEKRNQLENIVDTKSYCINVVRNACLNKLRGKKQHLSTDEVTDIDSAEDVHTELEWRDFYGIVSKAMTRLPVDQRNVFRMSVYGGFSNIEIAELLGITQGNVRVLLSRARIKIRKLLSK